MTRLEDQFLSADAHLQVVLSGMRVPLRTVPREPVEFPPPDDTLFSITRQNAAGMLAPFGDTNRTVRARRRLGIAGRGLRA
jgi:hypothetical protein